MKTSVTSQSHRELVQEITQLNKDQDVKTNDHVSPIHGVFHIFAVRVRDDAGFVTEARSGPQPHGSDHGKSRFEAARRDQDDQRMSQSGAATHASVDPLGTDGDGARLRLGTHYSEDHRDAASATFERADKSSTFRPSWCVLTV